MSLISWPRKRFLKLNTKELHWNRTHIHKNVFSGVFQKVYNFALYESCKTFSAETTYVWQVDLLWLQKTNYRKITNAAKLLNSQQTDHILDCFHHRFPVSAFKNVIVSMKKPCNISWPIREYMLPKIFRHSLFYGKVVLLPAKGKWRISTYIKLKIHDIHTDVIQDIKFVWICITAI